MNEALAELRPHKDLTTRGLFPARSAPNSEPNVVYISTNKERSNIHSGFLMF